MKSLATKYKQLWGEIKWGSVELLMGSYTYSTRIHYIIARKNSHKKIRKKTTCRMIPLSATAMLKPTHTWGQSIVVYRTPTYITYK